MKDAKTKALEHLYHALKESPLNKDEVSVGTYVKKQLSRESLNSSDETLYASEKATVDNGFDNVFKQVSESLAREGLQYKLSPAQVLAGKYAFAASKDVENFHKNVGSIKPEGTEIQNSFYNTRSIGLESFQNLVPSEGIRLATEKFGAQELNNIVVNTVSLAISAAAQDSFMELVFPMVVVDPLQSHVSTQVTYSVFGKGFKRFSGKVNRPEQYEMVLNMYKKELYNSDYVKLLPVLGTKANKEDDTELLLDKAVFVAPYKDVEKCNIAPLRFGKKIDIIGVSQTEADLANGIRDDSDILDKAIKLNSIFLEADVAGEKRYLKLDTSNIKGIAFNPRNEGGSTWTSVAFSHTFKINTSVASDFRPDFAATSKGKMFGDGVAEQILYLDIDCNITIDLGEGTVIKSSATSTLTGVKTADGEFTDSSSTQYKEALKLAELVKPVGYLLDATITNTNFKDKGIQGKVRGENYITNVGIKSSIGLTGEVDFAKKEGNQSDYDLFTIEEQSVYIDQQMCGNAVTVLFKFLDNMRIHAEAKTLDQVTTQTPSHHYIKPYLHEETLDLLKIVDSLKSSDRMEDIRSALLNIIRFRAIKMDRESNYRDAVKYRFKNNNKTLVAMCDTEIAAILTTNDGTTGQNNRIQLTDSLTLIVAESYYPEFTGKLILSYVTPEDNNKGAIPLLNVGATLYSPMLNYTIGQKERDGGVVKELHNILRFEHIINLPVFTVFNVENVDAALEKVAVHTIAK